MNEWGKESLKRDRSVYVDFFDATSTVGATRKMGQTSVGFLLSVLQQNKKKMLEGP
jgi:hypothetical protein